MANNPKDAEKLDSLRKRLYARDGGAQMKKRTPLTRSAAPADVARSWQAPPSADKRKEPPHPAPSSPENMPRKKYTNNYRVKLLLAGVVFFVFMLLLSSLFFIFGNNSISGENITLKISGPFAVGGGEEMPIQISVANQNAIPIESAILIINYPPGTQSASEPGKELFNERQELGSLEPGEVRNLQVKGVMFGEENEERAVSASVEYRVRGSNATFYKDAAPLRFKINSSPVILNVDAVRRVTSGQEVDMEISVESNSPTPLKGVLITAAYPFGFDFTTSEPNPVAGRNTWLIDELPPEGKETIKIKGIVTGGQNDVRVFDFSVGVAGERDRLALAALFKTVSVEMEVEAPFLDVGVEINGSGNETVIVKNGEQVNVRISLKNTQDDTLYDSTIEAKLGGNALDDVNVTARNGFYDSRTHIARFDSSEMSALEEIAPGRTETAVLTIYPKKNISQTPEITLQVTVGARRLSESRVSQELSATAARTIRVEGGSSLSSSVAHSTGAFNNSGPTPPVAEETTEYTLQFEVAGGGNDTTGAQMTAVLPQYVAWLNNISGDGTVAYNATTRTMTWDIGSLSGGETKDVSAQVAVTPSVGQVGQIPTIVERQYFRATDRFTGTVIRAEAPARTTATPSDDGRVVGASE